MTEIRVKIFLCWFYFFPFFSFFKYIYMYLRIYRKKSQLIPDETKLHDNKPLFVMSKGTQNRQAAQGLGWSYLTGFCSAFQEQQKNNTEKKKKKKNPIFSALINRTSSSLAPDAGSSLGWHHAGYKMNQRKHSLIWFPILILHPR